MVNTDEYINSMDKIHCIEILEAPSRDDTVFLELQQHGIKFLILTHNTQWCWT